MSHGLDGDEDDEEEVVELEDDSVKHGDPRDQTRPPVRALLLLALAGIGVVKQGFSGTEGFDSRRNFSSFDGGETPATYEVENSEKDSSTKWESHSRFANSSACVIKISPFVKTTNQTPKKPPFFFRFLCVGKKGKNKNNNNKKGYRKGDFGGGYGRHEQTGTWDVAV